MTPAAIGAALILLAYLVSDSGGGEPQGATSSEAQPRKRGPKPGSKRKPRAASASPAVVPEHAPRKRGPKPGSKRKPRAASDPASEPTTTEEPSGE